MPISNYPEQSTVATVLAKAARKRKAVLQPSGSPAALCPKLNWLLHGAGLGSSLPMDHNEAYRLPGEPWGWLQWLPKTPLQGHLSLRALTLAGTAVPGPQAQCPSPLPRLCTQLPELPPVHLHARVFPAAYSLGYLFQSQAGQQLGHPTAQQSLARLPGGTSLSPSPRAALAKPASSSPQVWKAEHLAGLDLGLQPSHEGAG